MAMRQQQRQSASAPSMAASEAPPLLLAAGTHPTAFSVVLVAAKAAAGAAVRADFAASLKALAGSNANLAQCVAMGFLSLFCCLTAISVVATGGGGKLTDVAALIGFYLLAILLLATGVLQMAKTTRDQRMAEIFELELLAPQLVGTAASRVMNSIAVAAAFALAVAIVVVMAVASGAPVEGSSFLLMAIAFLLTACVNLSKAWRDRFDALFLQRAAMLQPARIAEFARAVHSLELASHVFYLINVISALTSTAATVASAALSRELETNTKALLILALLFMVASAVNASKLVRDELELGAIKPTAQWKAITVLAILISIGAVFGVIGTICRTGSPPSYCALLFVGAFWMLASVITLSKITRDRDEKLRAATASNAANNAASSAERAA
jgi:hypothetical protein